MNNKKCFPGAEKYPSQQTQKSFLDNKVLIKFTTPSPLYLIKVLIYTPLPFKLAAIPLY